jgi:hypothetical protein
MHIQMRLSEKTDPNFLQIRLTAEYSKVTNGLGILRLLSIPFLKLEGESEFLH